MFGFFLPFLSKWDIMRAYLSVFGLSLRDPWGAGTGFGPAVGGNAARSEQFTDPAAAAGLCLDVYVRK
jgi:hypothetical protein